MNKEELDNIQELIERKITLAEVTGGLSSSDKKFIALWNYTMELENRIDKAIEYIEHYREYYKVDGKDYLKASRNYGLEDYQITELLKILKEDYEIN